MRIILPWHLLDWILQYKFVTPFMGTKEDCIA